MDGRISVEDLAAAWSLSFPDIKFVNTKPLAAILRHLDFRRMNPEDRADLSVWISTELCPSGMTMGAMMDRVFLWCRDGKIFASSRKELERLARSQRQRFLDAYLSRVADRLHPQAQASMEASLADPDSCQATPTFTS